MPVEKEFVDGDFTEALEKKIRNHDEMLKGIDRMENRNILNAKSTGEGKKLREDLIMRRTFLQSELEKIPKNISNFEVGGEDCYLSYLFSDEEITRAKLIFTYKQMKDLLKTEKSLCNALYSLGAKGHHIEEGEKWKTTEKNWQMYLSQSKIRVLKQSIQDLEGFVPLELLKSDFSASTEAVSGELEVSVTGIEGISGYEEESLMVQFWIDSSSKEPRKLKKKDPLVVEERLECNLAHNFEVTVFDKAGNMLAFLNFKLSWLSKHLQSKTFSRKLNETFKLIPEGTIQMQLRINKKMQSNNDSAGVKRSGALKGNKLDAAGHDFVNFDHGSFVLKCCHCGNLVWTGKRLQCRKCSFFCHNDCRDKVYVRCLANPRYKDYEDITSALTSKAKPHLLEKVLAKLPSFCSHCGRLIPITATAQRCKDCGIQFHKDCELYAMPLCGLSVKEGNELAEKFAELQVESHMAEISLRKLTLITFSFPTFDEEDFEFLAVIGKGNFGKVMMARYKENGQLYALKVLKKSNIIENDERESVLAERFVFSEISNKDLHFPFLITCHGIFQNATRIFFVMEYVGGGDLMFHIQQKKFTESQAKFFAAEVLLALEYLHKRDIVYRDLKLDNILVCLDGHVKLADYGLCKADMFTDTTTKTFCGTPEFMAPEIVKGKPYTRNVDWWAFGVLLFELLFAQAPFKGKGEVLIFRSIVAGRVNFPDHATSIARDLISKLLTKDPSARLASADAIKRHPFFSTIDFGKLLTRRLDPPFKPTLTSPADVGNFDREFTEEAPVLTPMPSLKLKDIDQDFFQNFSK